MSKKNLNMSMIIGKSSLGPAVPVFFDPHYPISLPKPPLTLVTGSPGSGKTFFSELLVSQASISNKFNFVLDYKGDFTVLKKMSDKGYIGKTYVWSLLDPDNEDVLIDNVGILDPMNLFDSDKENAALTYDIIKILHDKELTDIQANYLRPLIGDVSKTGSERSFDALITKLRSNPRDDISALGTSLDTTLNSAIGKLLKRPRRTVPRKINFKSGTIVVSLMGLKLPVASKDKRIYTTEERVSLAVMDLITRLVVKVMGENSKIRKTLIIDEAWSLMANNTTANMIKEVALLGRSRNLATILIMQSPRHLDVLNSAGVGEVDNTISCRFAFRNTSDEDNKITIEDMKIPDKSWAQAIPHFETGTCLMQDGDGKTGVVKILASDTFASYFETNPNA